MNQIYIPLSEGNVKIIKNFIGMSRVSGLEQSGEPSFSFKEKREGIGTVSFDLFFRNSGIELPTWSLTVKVDTGVRFHDNAGKPGELYSYLDSYKIEQGSLEIKHKTSKFNVFSF